MHVMIDVETLGTRTDAAIMQIGAVFFEPVSGGKILNGDKAFNRFITFQDGVGSIDHGTLCFWLQEKSAARLGENLQKNSMTLAEALQEFMQWPKTIDMTWENIQGVWAKPANFDLSIITSAFAKFGMQPPWDHRKTRCARTLFEITGGEPEIDWTGFVHHDALDDAVGQAMQVQKAIANSSR